MIRIVTASAGDQSAWSSPDASVPDAAKDAAETIAKPSPAPKVSPTSARGSSLRASAGIGTG